MYSGDICAKRRCRYFCTEESGLFKILIDFIRCHRCNSRPIFVPKRNCWSLVSCNWCLPYKDESEIFKCVSERNLNWILNFKMHSLLFSACLAILSVLSSSSLGDVLHDGDMILTPAQMKLYGAGDEDSAPFAGAGVPKSDIWPKGVIA